MTYFANVPEEEVVVRKRKVRKMSVEREAYIKAYIKKNFYGVVMGEEDDNT